jgi:hypothetical protein
MQGVVTFFWAGAREDGWLRCARHDAASAGENQKFFASFFQKRSAFLPVF